MCVAEFGGSIVALPHPNFWTVIRDLASLQYLTYLADHNNGQDRICFRPLRDATFYVIHREGTDRALWRWESRIHARRMEEVPTGVLLALEQHE